MAYKKKSERQEEVRNQLIASIASEGKDFLDYDPVGLPDEKDLANIKTIMRNHERVHPGEVAAYVAEAKKDKEMAIFDRLHGQLKSGTMRRTLVLPGCLVRDIEESYPLMFKNRAHIGWFKKHFPQVVTY